MCRRKASYLIAAFLFACVLVSCRQASNLEGATRPSRAVVRVNLHLMGSCPFSREVLSGLLPALDAVGPAAELRLHHIGGVLKSGTPDSMYGAPDILAGKQQLCAEELGGRDGLLALLQCQLDEDNAACARVLTERLANCVASPRAERMLLASFERSRRMGVQASPSLFLNDAKYEGGSSPTHFVRALCKAAPVADREGIPACEELPPTVEVRVTVVADADCTGPSCDTTAFRKFVRRNFAGAHIERIDWRRPRAQQLHAAAGRPPLPFAVFSGAVLEDAYGYPRVRDQLRRLEPGGRFLLTLGKHQPRELTATRHAR